MISNRIDRLSVICGDKPVIYQIVIDDLFAIIKLIKAEEFVKSDYIDWISNLPGLIIFYLSAGTILRVYMHSRYFPSVCSTACLDVKLICLKGPHRNHKVSRPHKLSLTPNT